MTVPADAKPGRYVVLLWIGGTVPCNKLVLGRVQSPAFEVVAP